MNIKVNYNDTTGGIIGFYPDDIAYTTIPEPYIEIDETTHLDCINNQGLRRVDIEAKSIIVYTPPEPTAAELKQQKLDALNVEYEVLYQSLRDSLSSAYLTDGANVETRQLALQAQYMAYTEEKKIKKAAILND